MIDFTSLISRRSALAVGASGLIGLSGLRPLPAQNPAQGFTFALIGDLGYVPSEEPWLENVFTELSKDTALSFVVYIGDLSSPRYGCTDEVQARRLAQIRSSSARTSVLRDCWSRSHERISNSEAARVGSRRSPTWWTVGHRFKLRYRWGCIPLHDLVRARRSC
jgi:hypothetical protein